MNREQPPLPPEVRALLDHEREIAPLPATVRARAIARARAALVAGVAGAARESLAPELVFDGVERASESLGFLDGRREEARLAR